MLMQYCALSKRLVSKVLLSSLKCSSYDLATVSAFPPLFRVLNLQSKYRPSLRFYVTANDSVASLSNDNATMHPHPRRTYQVVVAATRDMGIGKDGKLPWRFPSDLKFFKELTTTTSDPGKKNAVVMGRKTWESIPLQYRPLHGRLNVVLTRSGRFDIASAENVVTCESIPLALELLAEAPYCLSIEKVFVIGGGQVFREALNAPGCDVIHITEIDSSIECDTFIPAIDLSLFQPWYSSQPFVENSIRFSFVTYARVRNFPTGNLTEKSEMECGSSDFNKFEVKKFTFLPKLIFERHDEYMYLRLVQEIISIGNQKYDRAGTGYLSIFGCQMKFNLCRSFLLLTTKSILWQGVVENLLWFIGGSTNSKVLLEKDIDVWDGNESRDYIESIGLADREESDVGPMDSCGYTLVPVCRYTKMHADQGFDQLLDVIDKIKNRPDDRRIILSAWNPSDLKLMSPPCHMLAQFSVANGELSCQMYQCSGDMGVGGPLNIASYALLTYMATHVCVIVPGDFIHVIEDAYYKTHIRRLQEQLLRI